MISYYITYHINFILDDTILYYTKALAQWATHVARLAVTEVGRGSGTCARSGICQTVWGRLDRPLRGGTSLQDGKCVQTDRDSQVKSEEQILAQSQHSAVFTLKADPGKHRDVLQDSWSWEAAMVGTRFGDEVSTAGVTRYLWVDSLRM